MKTLKYTMLLSFMLILSACGGGSQTPTDRSLVFNLVPPDYFSGNYSASYTLNGSFDLVSVTDSIPLNGSIRIYSASPPTTRLNGKTVNEIKSALTLTAPSLGMPLSTESSNYYSTSTTGTILEGYKDIDSIVYTSSLTTPVPHTATIGISGKVSTFAGSVLSWALIDGFDGKAKFVITEVTDVGIATISYTITQDGSRIKYSLVGNITEGRIIVSGAKKN